MQAARHEQFSAVIDKRGRGKGDWETALHMRPTDVQVARLCATHGYTAACARWSWLHPRTIGYMAQRGRRELKKAA